MVFDIQRIQSRQFTQKTNVSANIQNFFYKDRNGEKLLNLFILYVDMQTFYPIQDNDLSFQIDYVTLTNETF